MDVNRRDFLAGAQAHLNIDRRTIRALSKTKPIIVR
jgi:hypothetical protein